MMPRLVLSRPQRSAYTRSDIEIRFSVKIEYQVEFRTSRARSEIKSYDVAIRLRVDDVFRQNALRTSVPIGATPLKAKSH